VNGRAAAASRRQRSCGLPGICGGILDIVKFRVVGASIGVAPDDVDTPVQYKRAQVIPCRGEWRCLASRFGPRIIDLVRNYRDLIRSAPPDYVNLPVKDNDAHRASWAADGRRFPSRILRNVVFECQVKRPTLGNSGIAAHCIDLPVRRGHSDMA
jgi:hypothetical protein